MVTSTAMVISSPKILDPFRCCPERSRSLNGADDPLEMETDHQRGGKKQPREQMMTPTQAVLLAHIEGKAARAIRPHASGDTRLKQRKKVHPKHYVRHISFVTNDYYKIGMTIPSH